MNNAVDRNLELKVRCDPGGIADVRSTLERVGIPVVQRLLQTDTYFGVPRGRLKLRRIEELPDAPADHIGERSTELIGYERPLEAGSRWSHYVVARVDPDVAVRLHDALALTHDVLGVVRKHREVAHWGATRIHLDVVEKLGEFIELETVVTGQEDDVAAAEHRLVIDRLGLDRWTIVAGSYSDLMLG